MCMDREQDHSTKKEEARDKKLAQAFLDLEEKIADLQSMSTVLQMVFQEALRENVHRDDEGILVARMSDREMNALSYSAIHLEDLIEATNKQYNEAFKGWARTA